MTNEAEPLLAGKNVSVTFGFGPAAFDAVHDATVHVLPGEAVGIVGESGSGKSTLARVLVGLQRPSNGTVLLDGETVVAAHTKVQFPGSERWKVQMVFQDPYSSLNPRQRAWQAVAEAVQVWSHVSGKQARIDALGLLDSMGVSAEQAQQYPKSLSGGQLQRISVARALALKPRVLIADEPTSSIDQSAQAQLLNLLRHLQEERKLSIIFISHDLSIIRYLTSRVYVMRQGEIVETGNTAAVFDAPVHPYTRLLINSIPGHHN
jgi:peptide/nickel transport system ATP-binding protein